MKEKIYTYRCIICNNKVEYGWRLSKGNICLCGKECWLKHQKQLWALQRKNSILPKWLLQKGVIDYFPNIYFRGYEHSSLQYTKKRLKTLKSKKKRKEYLSWKKRLEGILGMPNSMYLEKDVEKAFAELLDKVGIRKNPEKEK